MDYVPVQVPEHLYLQCLAFLGSAGMELHASAEIVAENEQLRQQVYDQHQEIGRLQALLTEALAAAGKLDQDDSYPDHGPEDDAAAAMGLPSATAGTLP